MMWKLLFKCRNCGGFCSNEIPVDDDRKTALEDAVYGRGETRLCNALHSNNHHCLREKETYGIVDVVGFEKVE